MASRLLLGAAWPTAAVWPFCTSTVSIREPLTVRTTCAPRVGSGTGRYCEVLYQRPPTLQPRSFRASTTPVIVSVVPFGCAITSTPATVTFVTAGRLVQKYQPPR